MGFDRRELYTSAVGFVRMPPAKGRLKPRLAGGNVNKPMAAPIVIIFGAGTQFYEKLACCFRAIPGRTHGSRASRRKSVKRPLATACCMADYFIPAARGLGL